MIDRTDSTSQVARIEINKNNYIYDQNESMENIKNKNNRKHITINVAVNVYSADKTWKILHRHYELSSSYWDQ